MGTSNRYTKIIEDIFRRRYVDGDTSVAFTRDDIEESAARLKIKLPKNLGDVVYSFRFRTMLPDSIVQKRIVTNLG